MKDAVGNELNVGDKIVACVPHGRNSGASLVRGTVIGFTKQYVKAIIPTYNNKSPEERNIMANKIIKLLP